MYLSIRDFWTIRSVVNSRLWPILNSGVKLMYVLSKYLFNDVVAYSRNDYKSLENDYN